MSDIKFIGEYVQIEGDVLRVTCFDVVLDNAGRRSSNAGQRRALVHDFQDGLTLNWASDYPGGITLNGKVAVGELTGGHLYVRHHDLHLDNAGRRSAPSGLRRALVHDFKDGLTLNWARDYPGGVTVNGDVKMPDGATTEALRGTELKCSHHTLHLDHAAHRPLRGPVGRGPNAAAKTAAKAAAKTSPSAKASAPARGPGGLGGSVGIDGVRIDPNLQVLPLLRQRRALMHDAGDGLTVNVDGDYTGGVTIHGTVKLPGSLAIKGQDVMALIADLQAKVSALEARVAALETPPPPSP